MPVRRVTIALCLGAALVAACAAEGVRISTIAPGTVDAVTMNSSPLGSAATAASKSAIVVTPGLNRNSALRPGKNAPAFGALATAMNATVTRLKSMFEEEAARLESVRREANCDTLTGLANRSYFMARLREAFAGFERQALASDRAALAAYAHNLRANPALDGMVLLQKGSRLSVQPVRQRVLQRMLQW